MQISIKKSDNVHLIIGPNGMCNCGEDGLTCLEQLVNRPAETAEVQKPAHNKQIMPCRMYAGVLEHCDVFGEGKCGCTPCQLAQA